MTSKLNLFKYSGFINGYHYPSVRLLVEQISLNPEQLNQLYKIFASILNGVEAQTDSASNTSAEKMFANLVVSVVYRMQEHVGLAPYEDALIQADTSGSENIRLIMPVHDCLLHALFDYLTYLIELIKATNQNTAFGDLENRTRLHLEQLKSFQFKSSNTTGFARAAYESQIPIDYLFGDLIQYGQGQQSRRLNSSFTDETSQIAAAIARNKQLAASLMDKSGLPVAKHYLVHNVQSAIKAAKTLGYPVVIKPADQDGGVGVTALLNNQDEVEKAFHLANQYSKNILVEEHVFGSDYRLVVFDDQLIWAVKRIPAGVIGDGLKTIKQLVDQLNLDPRRSSALGSPLKPILWNQEIETNLKNKNLNADSVPQKNQFVQLRNEANIALGGEPVAVFDQVHPDNRDLAVRAAQCLRLDLAGIDLIIEDISKSWLDIGASICEVNAQPNIGSMTSKHLYQQILMTMLPSQGRIPIIFVFTGGADSAELFDKVMSGFIDKMTVGLYKDHHLYINQSIINPSKVGLLEGVRMLTLNKSIQAIIIEISDINELSTGLPVSRYDLLVVNSPIEKDIDTNGSIKIESNLNTIFDSILLACDGHIMVHNNHLLASELASATDVAVVNFDEQQAMIEKLINFTINYHS